MTGFTENERQKLLDAGFTIFENKRFGEEAFKIAYFDNGGNVRCYVEKEFDEFYTAKLKGLSVDFVVPLKNVQQAVSFVDRTISFTYNTQKEVERIVTNIFVSKEALQ